ncbi:MAG: metalloregulator ArsR/SmtB family transcription factor [Bacteroidota bacterium]
MTTPTDDQLAALGKALSHPARLAILRDLSARGTCVCGQIVDVLPLAQSTVSQHLKVLRQAGLVQGTVDGTRTCYCIDPATLSQAREAFAGLFASLNACSCTDCACC